MSYLRQISAASQRLGRWPIALVTVLALAILILLPNLGETGLWEPQERAVADRAALPQGLEAERAAKKLLQTAQQAGEVARPQPVERASEPPPCAKTAPPDAVARSLTPRAIKAGRDGIADDDFGRKLPLAVFGLLAVLAAAGTAMRLAGPRAGIVTAIALLAMPLLVLQARMLTSELGTACGASLIVYALTALSRPYRGRGALGLVADAAVSTLALTAGVALGFLGGGALLGLAVPIGAFAAAGGLGAPFVATLVRRGGLARASAHLPALLATLAAALLLGLLAWQLYDVKDPHPGIVPQARQIFGQAIVPEGCWSWALGGVWRPDDDVRFIFDSTFEQIAYGTFPWGVLAPIAMAALLRDPDPARRAAGALALAWAGAAWVATEAFQRKVGFSIWAGFPALAIAVGVWLDGVLARRGRLGGGGGDGGGGGGDAAHADPGDAADPAAVRAGALLIGLFVLLAVVDLGKDMYAFAEKVTSMFTGGDAVVYPKEARLLGLPAKLWPLLLGGLVALGFALSMMLWRTGDEPAARRRRRISMWAAAGALAASCAAAAFWAYAWHPGLGVHLSSKTIFDTYRELRAPGDELVIMGDLGQATRVYGDACDPAPTAASGVSAPATPEELAACKQRKLEPVQTRDQVVGALKRPSRVFAIAPQTELCALHRELGDQPYFVLEERNLRNLLISNKLDGATDRNPLATMIVHAEPKDIPTRPSGRVVFDNKIELLGWRLPSRIGRRDSFEVTLYYKILAPVGATWKSLVHFDGNSGRAGIADHEPINGRCATSTWQPGDFIIDRFRATGASGAYPSGKIDMWIGFFTGSSPSFRNMPVSAAPPAMRDQMDRVKIATLLLD